MVFGEGSLQVWVGLGQVHQAQSIRARVACRHASLRPAVGLHGATPLLLVFDQAAVGAAWIEPVEHANLPRGEARQSGELPALSVLSA